MGKQKYKVCSLCKKELPLNRKNFKRIIDKDTGKETYNSICRNCEKQQKDKEYANEYKDQSEFSEHPYYVYRNNKDKRCKHCKQIQNKQARKNYSNETKLYKVLQERWLGARDRANNKGIPFTITKEDLLELWENQEGLCNISKISMTFELDNGRVFTNVSVDQKKPGQGYTKDNIQLVCSAVNQLKSNWDMDTVLYICKQIINNYDG